MARPLSEISHDLLIGHGYAGVPSEPASMEQSRNPQNI
ncbi:hypothetical protein ACCUM_0481 [Candidatus Accumulibacter phosphatis]|uniref:Uncharacterized protein n=1 Tax=Candidatus Accumulibacter phosphatis TaxID=327160 RepID=A0A5S4EKB9_9PROT|nr:hypothetical protein ACCUM_0481 [Candidatus Accumulibacter phosphatis]